MNIDVLSLLLYILSGAGVGVLIGLTGVGGGSLMTPLLILFNIPYQIAIGTDLLYAAITKASGVVMHQKRGNIQWPIVIAMASGSIPASILTAFFIHSIFDGADDYKGILTTTLGIMLIMTAIVLFYRKRIQKFASSRAKNTQIVANNRKNYWVTFFCGILLGILVTLSSVGAGAFGTAILMILFSRLPAMHIIGTDLAHAVPLTFVAGMSHFLILKNVDFFLLLGLLIGSLPAVYIGTKIGAKLPERFMYNLLAFILMVLGARFAFF